jgi:LPXTG-site transpeptidase (sortase) family protein
MQRKNAGCLGAIIPLIVVACLSLMIVSGIVTWLAAREGTGLGELLADMLRGQQSARPVALPSVPLPTLTPPPPPPTPIPVAVVAPAEPVTQVPPTPQPTVSLATEASNPGTVMPTATEPSLQAETEPQVGTSIESPIRPGSPFPERPATRLVIPAMNLDIPVTISPIVNQTWQVDQLGADFVGHLEGTASPGDSGNVVLAGHVTIAHNVYGPFAGLGQLKQGDPIIIYANDQSYTYIVDYHQLVDRTDVQVAYSTDAAQVTLITCSNWSNELEAYQQRLIVVGHLAGEGS